MKFVFISGYVFFKYFDTGIFSITFVDFPKVIFMFNPGKRWGRYFEIIVVVAIVVVIVAIVVAKIYSIIIQKILLKIKTELPK